MTRIATRAFVLAVLMLIACGGGESSTTSTTVLPAPDTAVPASGSATTAQQTNATATSEVTTGQASDESPQDWAAFEPAFMAGCTADFSEAECGCMFDEFQQRYEFADFFEWAYQAQDDPRIVEVADFCAR